MPTRKTFKVKDDEAIDQGSPVKLDAGELVPCTAADDECIGIIEDGSEDGGELRAVNVLGPCLIKVDSDGGPAIVAGDLLVPGANGKAVKDSGSGARRVIAEAFEDSDGEDGALINCVVGRVFEDRS